MLKGAFDGNVAFAKGVSVPNGADPNGAAELDPNGAAGTKGSPPPDPTGALGKGAAELNGSRSMSDFSGKYAVDDGGADTGAENGAGAGAANGAGAGAANGAGAGAANGDVAGSPYGADTAPPGA